MLTWGLGLRSSQSLFVLLAFEEQSKMRSTDSSKLTSRNRSLCHGRGSEETPLLGIQRKSGTQKGGAALSANPPVRRSSLFVLHCLAPRPQKTQKSAKSLNFDH